MNRLSERTSCLLNYKITRVSFNEEILRNDLLLMMDNIHSELTSVSTRLLLVSVIIISFCDRFWGNTLKKILIVTVKINISANQ
jgi:hypothetical protein